MLAMVGDDRLKKIREIESAMAAGASEADACAVSGVSVAWFRRWADRLSAGGISALSDAPRSGRPRSVELTDSDALALRERYLRSNRARGYGSMTLTARSLAREGVLSPAVTEAVLAPRASKHTLPRAVADAMRTAPAVVARYRDERSGANDGIYAPGWLRMTEDGSRRLYPGERQVWDDASVNVGVVVPWPRGGDACSDKFGVRVARFQLLLGIDCATDHCAGWSFVCRASDAYGAGDVVRAFHGVWSRACGAPDEVVLEGGSWQAERTLKFLEAAGVRVISAKGRPNQKLVENYFNRLWSVMSVKLPPRGQIGRFRGEMRAENLQWARCRAGALDPRGVFPGYEEVVTALNESIAYLEDERVESRVYGSWCPGEAWRAETDAGTRRGHRLPIDLWRHALPVVADVVVRRGGCVKVRADSPFGFAWDYVFAWDDGFKFDGRRVIVRFDPWAIRSGAVVEDAESGKVLTESAGCISPAPDVAAKRGCIDPRAEARRVKKASRATVLEIVRASDARTGAPLPAVATARGTSPEMLGEDYRHGRAAHVEIAETLEETPAAVRRANGSARRATDWAAMEEAAGVFGA